MALELASTIVCMSKLHSAYKYLAGTLQYSQVLDYYLKTEVTEHCVADPFHKVDIPDAILAHLS